LHEQIKRLKDKKLENQGLRNRVDKSENDEEISRLRDHNQSLFTQIKKLKNDKNSLQGKLEQLTNKEALINKETMTNLIELEKSFGVKIEVMEKQTNIDPIDITNQKDANLVEVGISLDSLELSGLSSGS
jgi:predicted nuclease with TOPRIM domain